MSPSQSPRPGSQSVKPHLLSTQNGSPLSRGQRLPHAPQLSTLFTEASQPVSGSSSQSPKPLSHSITHFEFTQSGVPCRSVQTMPHPPQFSMSVLPLTSQPSLSSVLQRR